MTARVVSVLMVACQFIPFSVTPRSRQVWDWVTVPVLGGPVPVVSAFFCFFAVLMLLRAPRMAWLPAAVWLIFAAAAFYLRKHSDAVVWTWLWSVVFLTGAAAIAVSVWIRLHPPPDPTNAEAFE